MFTALKFTEYFASSSLEARLLVIAIGLSTLFFAVGYLVFPVNRKTFFRFGVGVLGLLVALEWCDFLWMQTLFPHGAYRNPGIGGAYMVLYLPFWQLIVVVLLTLVNRRSERGLKVKRMTSQGQ